MLFLCRKGEANGEERHAFDHLQDIEILVQMQQGGQDPDVYRHIKSNRDSNNPRIIFPADHRGAH